MKKIIFFLILLISSMPTVKAECSDEEIIRLSKVANNITTSYEYEEKTKSFNITFTNVNKSLVIKDVAHDKYYNESVEFTIRNFKSGDYKFSIEASDINCTEDILVTKYVNLPYYNKYYDTDDCKGIKEYSYCSKWVQKEISYNIFKKKITEYKESLNKEQKVEKIEEPLSEKIKKVIVDIYVNYYYIILPVFITILCIIIYVKDKNDQII